MGILDRLKSLFKSEESEAPEEVVDKPVSLEDIDSFLDKKDREIGESFNEKKSVLLKEISSFLEGIRENVGKLEAVDLDKVKADERLIRVTKQGRESYTIQLNKLIEDLEEFTERDKDYEVGSIDMRIEEFSKNSFNSYHKVTVLIGKEMEAIKYGIIRIKKSEASFKKANEDLIKKSGILRDLIRKNVSRKNEIDLSNKISKEMEEIKGVYEGNERELEEIDKEISKIKESSEYKKREKLGLEKDDKSRLLEDVEANVKALFDRRILEKYTHLNRDDVYAKIAQKYIANPEKALLSDEEIEIFKVLRYIGGKIENGELKIKEAEKALEKINVDKEVFVKHREDLLGFTGEIEKLGGEIDGIKLDFGNLIVDKSRVEGKIEESKQKVETLNKKREKIDKLVLELGGELKEGAVGF